MKKIRETVTENEALLIEAEESLLADFQVALHWLMTDKKISRAALAERMGVSKARITHLLRPEANPTLKTAARAFTALGEACELSTPRLSELKADYVFLSETEWESPKTVSKLDAQKSEHEIRLLYDTLGGLNERFSSRTNDNSKQSFAWEERDRKVAYG
jgi:transcriptional regulator with XRE-family HTH domain